ncbi:BIR protein [Plasmodium berghei]|uniref:BIR protein n=1 Tax=Plasmodium berghei TaxID=5821 RepID=A0A0Y9U8G4_PLABE|nr:BIR protein [Plasmodium berghei]
MNDDLCLKFSVLRNYIPDKLTDTAKLKFDDNSDFMQYCPENDSKKNECNNNLDIITAGFLWLLEHCYSISNDRSYNENNTNPSFFLYMNSWLSYKLKQIIDKNFTKINDFYNEHVKNSDKYNRFITDAYRISDLEEFIDKQNDFLNINIEDMSKFYDAFKLLCNMHDKVARNQTGDILLNNATSFVEKYTELNNRYNNGAPHNKIFYVLSDDYNNLKNTCKEAKDSNFPPLPEIKTQQITIKNPEQNSAQTSEVTSSNSSIGNKLFTVLSIFGAIAFFLGISYKYSLFGFRKQTQKQYLREKIKNIQKRMNY